MLNILRKCALSDMSKKKTVNDDNNIHLHINILSIKTKDYYKYKSKLERCVLRIKFP